ncbi:MAG: cytochrome c [Myxococcota bacterium]|nr:cytochrome c [Deltaproteobacteria bacterium]MDQ3341087.1 cytochrome c [Myxococcota bacterium]
MRRVLPLVLVAACNTSTGAGSSVDGADLYAKFCAPCHGVAGKPDATMIARLGVRDLTSPELRARITPALIDYQIRAGSQNKLMPSFAGAFTDEQIKAIAEYVASPKFLAR